MSLRPLLYVVAASLALGLSSCKTPDEHAKPGTAFAAPQGRKGVLIHRDSGLHFPVTVAGFHRVRHVQYESTGTDVSVGYTHDDPRVVGTIYVYPRKGGNIEDELARRIAEVQARHPGARQISNTSAAVTPKHVRALSAEFRYAGPFGGENQSLRTRLIVAAHKDWFVVYRFYYAAHTQAAAEPLSAELVDDFAWE